MSLSALSDYLGHHIRKTFLVVLVVGYYGTSVLDFRHRDQLLVGDLAPEKQREDAFWVSQRGQAELKGKRDTKRRLLIQDREGDEFTKEQQKTEQGRKMLELEKVQRSLSLRFYATKMQRDLLMLEKEIEKVENNVKKEILEATRKARHQ